MSAFVRLCVFAPDLITGQVHLTVLLPRKPGVCVYNNGSVRLNAMHHCFTCLFKYVCVCMWKRERHCFIGVQWDG